MVHELEPLIDSMNKLIESAGHKFVSPFDPVVTEDFQIYLMEQHKFFQNVVVPTLNYKFPPGNWYLVTITSKPDHTRDDVIASYDELLSYMATRGSVQHAVIEKSNIWHVHAMVNLKTYAKNLKRDLQTHLGVIVDVSRKVSSVKRFNGLCKYILKREYEEKGATYDSTLRDGILYREGKGYTLKSLSE